MLSLDGFSFAFLCYCDGCSFEVSCALNPVANYCLIPFENLVSSRLGIVGEKTKGSKGVPSRFLLVVLLVFGDRLWRGNDELYHQPSSFA